MSESFWILGGNRGRHSCLCAAIITSNADLKGSQSWSIRDLKMPKHSLDQDQSCHVSWRPHITNMCNKARKLDCYIDVSISSNSTIVLKVYLSFVRPCLEYSSAAWSPHLKGEVEIIEKVHALKACTKSWDSSYEYLLKMTSLPSLQCRRLSATFITLYIDLLTFQMSP